MMMVSAPRFLSTHAYSGPFSPTTLSYIQVTRLQRDHKYISLTERTMGNKLT